MDYASPEGANYFRHHVDTEEKSSGTPVLDMYGRIVAIHTNTGCWSLDQADVTRGNSAFRLSALALISHTLQSLIASHGAWTSFASRDTPNSSGDHESFVSHRSAGLACSHPTSVMCRRKSDQAPWHDTGETVTCNMGGFSCINAQQSDALCDDYEVAYFCPSSTGSTSWIDDDGPAGAGDYERVAANVEKHATCEDPIGAQCSLVSSGADWTTTGEVVRCTASEGMVCVNNQQSDGQCHDYKARFVCPTYGGWSRWLDRDDVTGSGDNEPFTSHFNDGSVCPQPAGVQCRRKSDGRDWTGTGEAVSCTVTGGLVCLKADQPDGACDDYEVRWFYSNLLGNLCL
jgi:hypothetical protein